MGLWGLTHWEQRPPRPRPWDLVWARPPLSSSPSVPPARCPDAQVGSTGELGPRKLAKAPDSEVLEVGTGGLGLLKRRPMSSVSLRAAQGLLGRVQAEDMSLPWVLGDFEGPGGVPGRTCSPAVGSMEVGESGWPSAEQPLGFPGSWGRGHAVITESRSTHHRKR